MIINKLTARKVQTAGPGKYEDGGGLRIVVSHTGSKQWVMRYTIAGKRREAGLGSYPIVSLECARKKAIDYREKVVQGIDPLEVKPVAPPDKPTFTHCAALFIKHHRRGWKNRKHGRQWVSTLKTYVRPVIGNRPVDEIGTEEILQILTPIWISKNETAKRVQGRIENILDYAAARKWRDANNPARWRGHLDKLLLSPNKIQNVRHHPAMPYDMVAAFMAELRANTSISSYALQWLILTATRTSETLQGKWEEIDLKTQIWTIPSERMKAKRPHRVPLTDPAMAILDVSPRVAGNPYLFPGSRYSKPLSNMALLQLMRGMGYGVGGNKADYVPHGFRSSFRDWAGEVSSFPHDVCEMALAHVIENKAEAAYRRGDLFAKRRRMMQEWADHILSNKKSIPVIEATTVDQAVTAGNATPQLSRPVAS
jgi:integrase